MLRRKTAEREGGGGCGDLHAPEYTKLNEFISKDNYQIDT